MSQQINLYEERLRPRREFESGRNIALSFVALLVLVVALAVWARGGADRASAALAAVQGEVKSAQGQMNLLSKKVSEHKVSPALQAELESARSLFAARSEVVEYLDSGQLGSNSGFAGLMVGFSRVAQNDLWLTGFAVRRGGQEIEIRGSLLDASKLPGYVQRLGAEPVFQGRRFAALEMRRVDPAETKSEAGRSEDGAGAAAGGARVEFVLRSEPVAEAIPAGGSKP